jgi:hypothetical protein
MPTYGPWNREARQQWMQRMLALNPRYQCFIGMGGFAYNVPVDPTPVEHPAIWTSGAGPCIIIAMQNRASVGALAHFPGDVRPDVIANGVTAMRAAIGGTIASLTFAAGSELSITNWYDLMEEASQICGVTPVLMSPADRPRDGIYHGAIMFPLDRVLLLYSDRDPDRGAIMNLRAGNYDPTYFNIRNF